jgi:hypothetical protein
VDTAEEEYLQQLPLDEKKIDEKIILELEGKIGVHFPFEV